MNKSNWILPSLVFCLILALSLVPTASIAAVLIDCLDGGTTTDFIYRGFYVSAYPGTSLTGVDMFFSSHVGGDHTIQLTARAGTYDGPVIGTAQVTVALTADTYDLHPAQFVFASNPVSFEETVAFTMELVEGPENPLYGVDSDNPACPIIETVGTDPPLDTPRREGVRVRIHGAPPVANQTVSWGTIKSIYE